MAKAYASTIIDAPVESVWSVIRDFNGLPNWHPAIARSEIEEGRSADSVGCVRSFHLQNGAHVRERLLSFSDSDWTFAYNFETPAFPVEDYLATVRLIPVTDGDRTFAEWTATFEAAEGEAAKYEKIIGEDVFHGGWQALKQKLPAVKPEGERWNGGRPAKVFCSSVINGPVDRVWAIMRDFAGMGGWHGDISRMHMLGGRRSDEVGAVREFNFGGGQLHEQLLHLCDLTRSFSYRINKSPMPWLGYVAGARLWPVTDCDNTFAVWTANWTAAPEHDLELIPNVHNNVFQKAFNTLNSRYFNGPKAAPE